jgi:AcrR family transcriptional regulator
VSTLTSPSTNASPAGLPPRIPVDGSSPTRQKLLETAESLFHSEGFHGVGLKRILQEVGITKQAFYHHFESKEELVAEVLRWHDRWWREHCRQLLVERAGPHARRQLDEFVNLLVEVLEGDVFRGCFFINAVTQFPNKSDPIHRAALRAKDNIEAMVRDLALAAGADDAVMFARELSMIFEGGFAARYLRPPGDVVPVLRRMALNLFQLRLPAV